MLKISLTEKQKTMIDLVFLQIGADTIAVGYGTLEMRSHFFEGKNCFYSNNFFLDNATPWIIPEHYEELSVATFKKRFLSSAVQTENIHWLSTDDSKFRKFFLKIKQSIEEGLLEKIVPISFEAGTIPTSWMNATLETLTSRFINYLSSDLYLFGFQKNGSGLCGLTPELLFEQKDQKVISAALAGTKASQFGDRAIKNPKDIREHQIVIDDIRSVLEPFGDTKILETVPYWNGSLIHLRAKVELSLKEKNVTFDSLVNALHPTAAIGVYPRTPNALAILKGSDLKIPRQQFAAPFGLVKADGNSSICVIAIRSVFWQEENIRVGAGCGVIEESDLESELIEIGLKRKSVKEKLTIEQD